MDPQSLTRQELYDLVWSSSREELAKSLSGLSAAVITRICEEANIPLPGRGYWALLERGKKVVRPALPLRWPGHDSRVVLARSDSGHWTGETISDEDLVAAARPSKPMVDEDDLEALVRTAAAQILPIRPCRELTAPHAEIRKIQRAEERRRQKVTSSGYSWDSPRYDGPFFQRQLRIFNALFKGLAPVGQKPLLREEAKFERGVGTTYTLEASVQFGSMRVGLLFPMERSLSPKEATSYKPTQPVRLVLRGWHQGKPADIAWTDEPGKPLEKQLSDIAVAMLRQAEVQRRASLLHRYEWELERIEDARMRLAARAEKLRQERVDALLGYAEKYEQAQRIRQFATACERSGKTPGGAPMLEWLAFAHEVADSLDPSL